MRTRWLQKPKDHNMKSSKLLIQRQLLAKSQQKQCLERSCLQKIDENLKKCEEEMMGKVQ